MSELDRSRRDPTFEFDMTVEPLTRPTAPDVEEILGRPIHVLDHGFVRLVDYMGNDAAIVQAARVSYGVGTRKASEDAALIRYLLRHRHTSPFEMVEVKLHVKAPLFVARQWLRHRTASVNELSARYSILPEELYLPDETEISFQSVDNRQGRSPALVDEATSARVRELLLAGQRSAYSAYQELLDADIARELARIVLPVAVYSEWYWKINLHNLFHFLELRLDPHAQYEIRSYAGAIASIVERLTPVAYAAFVDYIRDAVSLSRVERELVATALQDAGVPAEQWRRLGKRERDEFSAKFDLDPARWPGLASAAPGRAGVTPPVEP